MLARKQFTYKQQVQRASGQVITETVRCFWSPEYAGIDSAVGETARVQVMRRNSWAPAVAVGKPELVD